MKVIFAIAIPLFLIGCQPNLEADQIIEVTPKDSPKQVTSNAGSSVENSSSLRINGIAPSKVKVGESYGFVPIVDGSISGTLTYSIVNKPSWATFNSAFGYLYGIPSSGDIGIYTNISISVNDGSKTVFLPSFSIQVASGLLISGVPQSALKVNQTFNFTPTVTNPSGGNLSFAVLNKPNWLFFNSSTGNLIGSPSTSDLGQINGIQLFVSNGSDTVGLSPFSIEVKPGLDISGGPDTKVITNSFYSFIPTVNNPEGGSLTFSITNKPSWATFNTTTGRLSGIPTVNNIGFTNNIKISVTNGTQTVSLENFNLQVTQGLIISGTPIGTTPANANYSFLPSMTNPNGGTLTFSIENKPSWVTFNSSTGLLYGVPTNNDLGTTTGISISVTNGVETTSLPSFFIQVKQGISISGTPNTTVQYPNSFNFTPSFVNPNGGNILFSILNKPTWANFNSSTGNLSGTPNVNQMGDYNSISISVTNGVETAVLPSFNLKVTQGLSISGSPSISTAIGNIYSFTPTVFNPVGGLLTYTITNKPSWAAFDTSTGLLQGQPSAPNIGQTSNITISVSNGYETVSLAPFNLSVFGTLNISGTPETSVRVGSNYSFIPSVANPSNGTLTFGISGKPSWATFNSNTGEISGTPTAQNMSTYPNISISVNDGQTTSYLPIFQIEVYDLLSISGSPSQSIVAGNSYSFTPVAENPNGGVLSYSIVNKPSWAVFNSSNGILSGNPTNSDVGTITGIVISVSNGTESASLTGFNIEVTMGVTTPMDILDNDSDGLSDGVDSDDDNDGVLDNDDPRPLDNSILALATHSARIFSYDQVYIRDDNPDANYSTKGFLQTRALSGVFATIGILYFDIPTNISGIEIGKIQSSELTIKSDDENDNLYIYGTRKIIPAASLATWNNIAPFFPFSPDWNKPLKMSDRYAVMDMTAAQASSATLERDLYPGKIAFFVDEDGDSGRDKLIKSNSETFLDINFTEKILPLLNVEQVTGTSSSEFGDQIQFNITLKSQPNYDVYMKVGLSDPARGQIIGDTTLIFTPTNYNQNHSVIIQGIDDGQNLGNKLNKLILNPLISYDNNFYGHNPDDIEFTNYSIKFTSLSASIPPANSGLGYSYTVDVLNKEVGKIKFDLFEAPIGMSINERTGVINWQPDISQVGDYEFDISASSETGGSRKKRVSIQVTSGSANPTSSALYVVPNHPLKGGNGTVSNPYSSVSKALSVAGPGTVIYIRGGRYFSETNVENVNGTNSNQIKITRLPGERVKLGFVSDAFYISESSSYLIFEGLELDGAAYNDHWNTLKNYWWDPNNGISGGAQGFNIDGKYITVKNNIIHDAYQKAVNIYAGRYVNVHGNLIYNIGHSSLSGGHGIMRKWLRDFNDADVYNSNYPYRWDFYGNLIMAVEQRIYSRVFNKGYANLTIDEGKAILIDPTTNTDPKSRIAHNIILYCGVDHIRLKSNPNVEVHNNSIHADLTRTDSSPDGITDKDELPNLKFYKNLVASKGIAFDVEDSFNNGSGGELVDLTRKFENFYAGGGTSNFSSGITNLGNDVDLLFTDVSNNNFTAGSGASIGSGIGQAEQQALMNIVADHGLELVSSGWQHDHLKNGEYIIENANPSFLDRTTYYLGDSSIEPGHKALYIKIIDSDGIWLYTKREINGVLWSSLQNPWLEETFKNVDIKKCDSCSGAYVYQILLPHEWFDHYDTGGTFQITNSDGTTTTIIQIDPQNAEHQTIMDYAAEGKSQSF